MIDQIMNMNKPLYLYNFSNAPTPKNVHFNSFKQIINHQVKLRQNLACP